MSENGRDRTMTEILSAADEPGELAPQLPERYAQEVQAGMARYWAVAQEAEKLRRSLDESTLEIQRLKVELDGAKDAERAHVQIVIDEAKIAQARAEIEASSLRDDITELRTAVAEEQRVTRAALAEAARLSAALTMIAGNCVEVLKGPPAQPRELIRH